MKSKFIGYILGGVALIFIGVAVRKYFFKSWRPYYQEKLYKAPRPLLVKALDFVQDSSSKGALDLGAGAGNDTAYLLKQGWNVWANDIQEEAIEIIRSRHDIQPYSHRLVLMHKDFNDLPWNEFPQFDLIYAGYSLPFARPAEFMKLWQHITQALRPGGIFVGHFFALDHEAFNWWLRRKMTFLSKEELLALFGGFTLELFEELHEKNERGALEHSFNVIAKKV